MLLTRDIQRYGARTSSNQDVSSLELPAFGDNHISTGEAGNRVKSVDAVFGEIFFQIAGDRIGEAAFEHHQLAPIDPRLACDAMSPHTRLRVDRLPTTHQHSLRIAAAEGAGPAEGTVIDQCDGPACRTHSRACRLRASARADDHEIVGFHEVSHPKASRTNATVNSKNPFHRYSHIAHFCSQLCQLQSAFTSRLHQRCYENFPHALSVAHQMIMLPPRMRTANASHA